MNPETTNMPGQPPVNKGKTWLYIVGGVLVIIIIAAAVWFMFGLRSWTILNGAEQAFDQNNYNAAIARTEAVLARDPHDVTALISKSLFLSQKGSLEFKEQEFGTQAASVALQATTISPNNSEAWRALGFSYEIRQMYAEAHEYYTKAIAFDPENPRALFNDAHVYDLEGDLLKAEAGYRAAIAADAMYDQAHGGLGRILAGKGELEEALAEFETIRANTTNVHNKAEASYSIALIKKAQGDLAAALTYAEEATTLDPVYSLGWYGLGTVLFSQATILNSGASLSDRGALIKASIAALNASIELNPNQSLAYVDLAIAFSLIGRPEFSLEALAKAEEVLPKDISLNAPDKLAVSERIEKVRITVKTVQARATQ